MICPKAAQPFSETKLNEREQTICELQEENDKLRAKLNTICVGLKSIAQITHWDGNQAKKVRKEALRLLTVVPDSAQTDELRASLCAAREALRKIANHDSYIPNGTYAYDVAREILIDPAPACPHQRKAEELAAHNVHLQKVARECLSSDDECLDAEERKVLWSSASRDFLAEHDAAKDARIAELEAKVENEKQSRIGYQDVVYAVCNYLDQLRPLGTRRLLAEKEPVMNALRAVMNGMRDLLVASEKQRGLRISELEAKLASATARFEKAEHDANEAQSLFDLQHSRTAIADALWLAAHPGSGAVLPDLGTLIDWLLGRAEAAEQDSALLNAMDTYKASIDYRGSWMEACTVILWDKAEHARAIQAAPNIREATSEALKQLKEQTK